MVRNHLKSKVRTLSDSSYGTEFVFLFSSVLLVKNVLETSVTIQAFVVQ